MLTRKHCLGIFLVLLAFLGGAFARHAYSESDREVIRITAKRFSYTPAQIVLKKGVPVTLELVSLDRLHGFHIPDLGIRTDILPGQTQRVDLLPMKTGRFVFLCDIFCGTDHEDMHGVIQVNE